MADPIVAVWKGGRLSRSDFEGWRLTFGAADSAESMRRAVLELTLADAAQSSGSRASVLTELRLEAVDHSVLVPLLRRHVVSGVEVSDHEVEDLRLSNPDAFQRPRKVRLMQLYKRVRRAELHEQVMAEMIDIRQRILEGADFESEARVHSESQSRFRGGRLGFVDPTQLPSGVADAVGKLQPGQISQPVEHRGGISIFRCEEIRDSRPPTPDEVRAKIRANLVRLRAHRLWADYLAELASRNSVEVMTPPAEHGLRFSDRVLGPDEVDALVTLMMPGQTTEDLAPSDLAALLTAWAQRTLAAKQATRLGLDLRTDVRNELRWRRISTVASAELDQRVIEYIEAPTEDAIRRAFDRDHQRYSLPPRFDLSVIQLGLLQGMPPDRVTESLHIADSIGDGTLSFAEAARMHSRHSSAPSGGRIGWLSRRELARWGPVAARAIQNLSPGESTPLLRLESGLWVFQLHNAKPGRPMTLDEAREAVVADLIKRQMAMIRSEIARQHLADIDFSIIRVSPRSLDEDAQRALGGHQTSAHDTTHGGPAASEEVLFR